ncbi:endonuclease/exonuclease/phosphatase family protein [Parabacteroides sp. OttesenSCG-928-N08]|nr:endonuclease/exonuclease/phosphatase family protein [Parabacteroides sp. OttesenSCG-928-N08]
MKQIVSGLLAVALSLMATYAVAQTPSDGEKEIRVATYNIRSGLGMDDLRDLNRTAAVINRIAPHIIALQEVDSVTGRSNHLDVVAELGRMTQMHGYYSAAIDFDGGKYGVGILTKEEPIRVKRLPLPGSEEARTLLIVELQDYVFASTHLSLRPEDRLASVEIIKQEAAKIGKPFIVAGDLNARPQSEVMQQMSEDFVLLNDTTAFTFPASQPRSCIDYLAYYKQEKAAFRVVRSWVEEEPLVSDHRPVVVDLQWIATKEE